MIIVVFRILIRNNWSWFIVIFVGIGYYKSAKQWWKHTWYHCTVTIRLHWENRCWFVHKFSFTRKRCWWVGTLRDFKIFLEFHKEESSFACVRISQRGSNPFSLLNCHLELGESWALSHARSIGKTRCGYIRRKDQVLHDKHTVSVR